MGWFKKKSSIEEIELERALLKILKRFQESKFKRGQKVIFGVNLDYFPVAKYIKERSFVTIDEVSICDDHFYYYIRECPGDFLWPEDVLKPYEGE